MSESSSEEESSSEQSGSDSSDDDEEDDDDRKNPAALVNSKVMIAFVCMSGYHCLNAEIAWTLCCVVMITDCCQICICA